ncbi:unnamed protein product [Hyaloperonospora brassicae]|uniref:RxLR effector candidate protein n=1 Tax=Hyaloperonospora brassicae TaxID=162125 RepID=A0AAV0UL74_HYABA|nr:unnamed protein product [Hyaloperonospora brassicae]
MTRNANDNDIGPRGIAKETIETARPSCSSDRSTWSFVQMNMTLLPIARPRPLSVPHQVQEGALRSTGKPCTPTQRQHQQRHRRTSHISPRRQDFDCSHGRPDVVTSGRRDHGRPPTATARSGTTRSFAAPWHGPPAAALMDTLTLARTDSAASRLRSDSDDVHLSPTPQSDSGYNSEKEWSATNSLLHRRMSYSSLSSASTCAAKGFFKGKRVLELQDEDRRFHPEDLGPSPTKRSRPY